MDKQNTEHRTSSSPCWESLEEWARTQIQGWLQDLLEAEVTELFGRRKSQRRQAVEAPPGYRNGYGKPRRLTLSVGTITVRRPRTRGLEDRFESRLLPLFVRRTREVSALLPELYLHGLAQGDLELALRGLLGADAPLSASTVARLTGKWQAEYEAWSQRRLNELEVVYLCLLGASFTIRASGDDAVRCRHSGISPTGQAFQHPPIDRKVLVGQGCQDLALPDLVHRHDRLRGPAMEAVQSVLRGPKARCPSPAASPPRRRAGPAAPGPRRASR